MTKLIDLFGHDVTAGAQPDWQAVVSSQHCPFVGKRCYKSRKSQPEISIGTCTVAYRRGPVIICPHRLLERQQIFTDCLHLLTGHEPGNELHLIPELSVPGGNIDYVLASVRGGKARDFVGIELQTLDTTGTVWPERQRFLQAQGVTGIDAADVESPKTYGINWKMTAKTILMQLHHKVQTFESVNRRLVLAVQDCLINYMAKEFSFGHLNDASISDPMHFHPYKLGASNAGHRLELGKRLSTDSEGIAKCLGLQSEAKIDLQVIFNAIAQKITSNTQFNVGHAPPAISINPEA